VFPRDALRCIGLPSDGPWPRFWRTISSPTVRHRYRTPSSPTCVQGTEGPRCNAGRLWFSRQVLRIRRDDSVVSGVWTSATTVATCSPGLYRPDRPLARARPEPVLQIAFRGAGQLLDERYGKRWRMTDRNAKIVASRIPILEVTRSSSGECFERRTDPPPHVWPQAVFDLSFVTELVRSQLVIRKLEIRDRALVQDSAVEDEVDEIVPGAVR